MSRMCIASVPARLTASVAETRKALSDGLGAVGEARLVAKVGVAQVERVEPELAQLVRRVVPRARSAVGPARP